MRLASAADALAMARAATAAPLEWAAKTTSLGERLARSFSSAAVGTSVSPLTYPEVAGPGTAISVPKWSAASDSLAPISSATCSDQIRTQSGLAL